MNTSFVDIEYIKKSSRQTKPHITKHKNVGTSLSLAKAKTFKELIQNEQLQTPVSENEASTTILKSKYKITKLIDEKKQMFGWALVSHEWKEDDDGNTVLKQLVDYQSDLIDQDALEEMAYTFVLKYREGGSDHLRGDQASCIESVALTIEKQQAIGIPTGAVPIGWWIGFQITDDVLWDGIKKGIYKDFSIEGEAIRTPVVIDDSSGTYSIAKGGGEKT